MDWLICSINANFLSIRLPGPADMLGPAGQHARAPAKFAATNSQPPADSVQSREAVLAAASKAHNLSMQEKPVVAPPAPVALKAAAKSLALVQATRLV